MDFKVKTPEGVICVVGCSNTDIHVIARILKVDIEDIELVNLKHIIPDDHIDWRNLAKDFDKQISHTLEMDPKLIEPFFPREKKSHNNRYVKRHNNKSKWK